MTARPLFWPALLLVVLVVAAARVFGAALFVEVWTWESGE